MTYFHNERKRKSAVHYWNEDKQDTYCRLWTTGGMRQTKPGYVITSSVPEGKWICTMCVNCERQNER